MFFLVIFSAFLTLTLEAQDPLRADAGEKQHFCFETDWISTNVGGNPTASGGTELYTYRWWNIPANIFFSETDSNPAVAFLGNMTVYVEVTDAVGDVAVDSVTITMSEEQISFAGSPQNLQIDYYINLGDSVFLNGNVFVFNKNSTFAWSPCESIVSNCNVSDGFWAKPMVTTEYTLTATDEFGCRETFFTAFYKVHVSGVGIDENNISDSFIISPNPVKDNLYFNEETQAEIIDIQGRTLMKTPKAAKSLNVSSLQAGVYFLKTNNTIKKFVKE